MRSGRPAAAARGFTYLVMLLAVALIGIGLVATSEVWSQSRQREKERELLFIGNQFRQAIALYYQRTPGMVKRFPETLQDLLEDKRYLVTQRHLRKIFADPVTGKPDWGIVPAPGGGIIGIYSRSNDKPIKAADFPAEDQSFEGAQRYSQWRFIYQPELNPVLQAPPQPPQSLPLSQRLSR